MNHDAWMIFAGLALLGFTGTALCAGLETGIYTLNRVRLRVRARSGDPAAQRLRRELGRPARALSVLLLGENGAAYVGSLSIAEILHGTGLDGWNLIAIEVLVFTPALFILSEMLPKELFRTHTDRWTYWLAPAITLYRWLFTVTLLLPIVLGATALVSRLLGVREEPRATARQRIGQLLKEGVGAGVLSLSQTTVADRALDLGDARIGALAIPWDRVVALPLDEAPAARSRLFRQRWFSRLPVIDRRGRVVGVVGWTEVVRGPERPTESLMRDPLVLPPDTPVLDALSMMRASGQRLAIVGAPGARTPLGIVTFKDLVEPITGKLAAW